MRRLVLLALIGVLSLALVPTATTAVNDSPENAIILTAENAGHADRLVGDTGGAVRFYRIDYPGDARPVRIELTASPGRETLGAAFGFKVYGPNGLVGEAPAEVAEVGWTRFTLTLTSTTAGTYLIQVYNYSNGIAADFSIQVSGLTQFPQPFAGPPSGSTPDQPHEISRPTLNVGGSIVGKQDGAFEYLAFDYAGGNVPLQIDLKYSPPTPFQNNAVGFNVYDERGLVGQGAETQRDGSGAAVSYTLIAEAGGRYLLQVFNYQADLTVNYVLAVSGAAGQVQQARDNTVPERAIVLNATTPAARGEITPGREATFNFFLLPYPGGNQEVTIRIAVDNVDGLFEKAVGFNLYRGSDLAGQVIAHLDSKGEKWIGSLTLVAGEPLAYGIQVFNYSSVAPVRYRLYVSGL